MTETDRCYSTAADFVAELCSRLGNVDAVRLITSDGKQHSGADFAGMVGALRTRLGADGVSEKDTVVFALRPTAVGIATLLALISIGSRVVLVDLREPEHLTMARLRTVRPTLLVTEPLLRLSSLMPMRAILGLLGRKVPRLGRLAPRVITVRKKKVKSRIVEVAKLDPTDGPHTDSEVLVIFTSGTTSNPKGVVYSQASLGRVISHFIELLGPMRGEVVLSTDYHSVIPSLLCDAIVVTGLFESHVALGQALQRYGVSTWFSTPPDALATSEYFDGGLVRRALLGSSPVTPSLIKRLRHRMPSVEVTGVYAMTEAIPVAVAPGAEIESFKGPGTLVGKPCVGIQVDIKDDGEIVLSGGRVARYLDNSDEGRICTGDLGHWDETGRLVLDGRKKDMIIVGSRNIYPLHYEDAFAEFLGVEAGALVGVPDEFGDETLFAVVEPQSGRPVSGKLVEQVVREISVSSLLSGLPIAGVLVVELPRSGRSSKLNRGQLRNLVRAAREVGGMRWIEDH